MASEEIRIRGTVQGVGFRPTVYRLAKASGLKGNVCNDGEGVLIRVLGSSESIEEFIRKLQNECPPLAKINQIIRKPYTGKLSNDNDDFIISSSISNSIKTEITPDAATCPQCKQEIFDPYSRWYRYPFTNCTHCGPRLSIIQAIPYDRKNTSMKAFSLCPQCEKEYNYVENRRFHAQPIACHTCGPKAWLERADGKPIVAYMFSMLDDVDAVCTLLQKGEIVAIKGIGGIHLACDATNESVVQKLRNRKKRYHKPFALMARDIEVIEKYCTPNPKEKQLLESPAAPIVLINKGMESREWGVGDSRRGRSEDFIAPSVAPGQNCLGFMLPYTPLHHLILKRMNRPIVLTSGNISDEPQCIDNDEAREKLKEIADYFLLHNREIINRLDDSVVRIIDDKVQIIRRARGYAPTPINLPAGFNNIPHILAMGGELKNTFCLLRDGEAILSQHLGDLENITNYTAYENTLNLYLNLFEHQPEAIAIDKHPEYLSTKLGKQLASANNTEIYNIQHHHAHIAACMAENGIPLDTQPILGIALDGLGYGEDAAIWGGEFLLADYCNFTRLATFKPVAMIGGEQAIKEPWRNIYAQLVSSFTWEDLNNQYGEVELFKFLQTKPLNLLNQLIAKKINSPLTSSAGRLFDAVAAAIGICREKTSYEGQAAIEMEALIDINEFNTNAFQSKETLRYPFQIDILDSIYSMDPRPMWQELLEDLKYKISPAIIATKFHIGLSKTIIEMVNKLSQQNSVKQVALTGGVFQNSILLKQITTELQTSGIKVLTHSQTPSNDGSISLGQAVIAAAKIIDKTSSKHQR
jgi:hydrogenase maturation protein HypF